MNLTEKQIEKQYIYNGKIVNLRVDNALLPNGAIAKREVVEHSGGVCVAALTDDNEILLVKQFRYPYMEPILEIPAGKREMGEVPAVCGRRELKEETGAKAEVFELLGEIYPTPGYCNEIIWLYLARNLTFSGTRFDEDEFLEIEKIPLTKAVEMVMNGELKDAKTQIAILKLNKLLAKD